jgi:glyoxylase-like metal-dependent hydrolase (beta-lactamase superfamily II)
MLVSVGVVAANAVAAIALAAIAVAASAAEPPSVTTTRIKPALYLLQGRGGNVVASVGGDGVLLVDDDYSQYAPAYDRAVAAISDANVRFIVNTHWHGDHTGSNEYWGKKDAVIVAHDNVRQRLSTLQVNKFLGRETPPSDPAAWPLVSYGDSMALHLNGNSIELQHYPRGHTDGDTVVFFTTDNVVHMGDHFFKDRFPFVDIGSGGNAAGFTDNVKAVLAKVDANTVIVPGHGSLANRADLQRYYQMLVETRAEVGAMKSSGMNLQQVQQRGLDSRWDAWGSGFINEEKWISFLYASFESS